MTLAQKVILIALLAVGGLCLIVGFTLMHHIGGFLRTVEEEAREQEREAEAREDGDEKSPEEIESNPESDGNR